MNLEDVLKSCPKNSTVINNIIKAYHKINNDIYDKISCAISGGADSDVMLDICHKCDNNNKIDYVWCDTGLEYQATKDHLRYLEEKYNIVIKVNKAIKPIPISCREYGQPFLSKITSEYISRLQKHNFDFVDGEWSELIKKYPNCKIALRWWCNKAGEGSSFNIKRNKWLKEFMIANPPTFKISNKCCTYAKKDVMKKYIKENDVDLNIMGVRKAEGGARATAYKSCFDNNIDSYDNYRPLFWYSDNDKSEYEEVCNVTHSKCYTEYGLKRTGCAGCPFGRNFEDELQVIEKYEPKLFKAVNKIFGDSYEYTRKYKKFCEEMDEKYGSYAAYLRQKDIRENDVVKEYDMIYGYDLSNYKTDKYESWKQTEDARRFFNRNNKCIQLYEHYDGGSLCLGYIFEEPINEIIANKHNTAVLSELNLLIRDGIIDGNILEDDDFKYQMIIIQE